MKKATREWVRKAEDDYQLAGLIHRGNEIFHDQLCFHCQQAAEKYLKALLEELGHSIPKIHELEELLARLVLHYPVLRSLRRGMNFLTKFAVTTRYPGTNATKRQAATAWRWTKRARHECRILLGMKSKRERKKSP